MATLSLWHSHYYWLLNVYVTIITCGWVTLFTWYSPQGWLLSEDGTLVSDGYSHNLVLSSDLVTLHLALEDTTDLVLSITLVTLLAWYSLLSWLL